MKSLGKWSVAWEIVPNSEYLDGKHYYFKESEHAVNYWVHSLQSDLLYSIQMMLVKNEWIEKGEVAFIDDMKGEKVNG